MLEKILPYEESFFYSLNGSDSCLMDHFIWLFSYKFTWIPLYLCFFILFIYKYRNNWKEYVLIFVSLFLVILICDQVASGILKPMIERYRPTHHPDFKDHVRILFGYRGGLYGFASSHASNAFGFATFTVLLFRNKWFSLLLFTHALITSYSRIYLGVHFISDIVAGALIGIFTGILIYKLYLYGRKKLIIKDKDESVIPRYNFKEVLGVYCTYFLIITFLLIFNNQLVKLTL
ncbi:MAG: phosphatase PAP2 family protein [Dysgonamonadaceae bacterium]|jgi:undecaprenyl-diphosphatase|nr:phosphatase PAP2 family protein [Dysgonamonadaceae bacterium]